MTNTKLHMYNASMEDIAITTSPIDDFTASNYVFWFYESLTVTMCV